MTGYLYDGDCVVAEFDARGKVWAQYIHGQGLGADVGSLICAQTLGADCAASERYYSHNWRGDTIGITDESGASLARYRYGAFGELIAGDGGIANNILFSGKRYDSASGLYYFGARYYDASSGRFISRDPMGYIDGPNEYVLAMNNPLLWIDPYGLCRWSGDIRTAYHSSFNTSYGNPINPDFNQPPGELQAVKASVNAYADIPIGTRKAIIGTGIGIGSGMVKGAITGGITGFLTAGPAGFATGIIVGVTPGAISGGIDGFLTANIPQADSRGSSTAYSGIVGLGTGIVSGGITGYIKESVAKISVGKIGGSIAGGMINGPMNALLNIATAPIEYELNKKATELEKKIIEWGRK